MKWFKYIGIVIVVLLAVLGLWAGYEILTFRLY